MTHLTVHLTKTAGKAIPLAALYRIVLYHGGFKAAQYKKIWKRIGIELLASDTAGVGAQCRKAYETHLCWLEDRCGVHAVMVCML